MYEAELEFPDMWRGAGVLRKNPFHGGGMDNKYILLAVLLCSIAEYFYELCRILTSP